MGYESLHITELLNVQCLQVDDVIPILLPAVYYGFGRCDSQIFAWWHYLFTRKLRCVQIIEQMSANWAIKV